MRHTLKAVFERQCDAQHLWDELLASGFAHEKMTRSDPLAPTLGTLSIVVDNIDRLLGARRGVGPGNEHRVTLATDSDSETERAVGIIRRFDPAGFEDIEGNMDEVDSSPVPDREAIDRAAMPVHYPRGTEPGVLQHRAHEDSRFFGTQDADAPPVGNTFQEPSASGPVWDSIDAADSPRPDATATEIYDDDRSHWNATYAGCAQNGIYEDYAPAYAFGREARCNEAGRGREWRTVEPELKSEWEARHLGALSAWDNFRDAVRHGWNDVRP